MPPGPDSQTAEQIAAALQAAIDVRDLVETLYTQIGTFTVPRTYNIQGTDYDLVVLPGWGLLNDIANYVFLAEKQP